MSYECGSATIMVFNAKEHKVLAIRLGCGRVSEPNPCPQCAKKRIDKLTKQIERERQNGSGTLYWKQVANADIRDITKNLSRYDTRYQKLPLEDGVIVIFSEHNKLWDDFGGEPLPTDENELEQFLTTASRTPKGKRISGTRSKKDKETGELVREAWGHPNEKQKSDDNKGIIVALPIGAVRSRLEIAGAVSGGFNYCDDVHQFSANESIQEEVLESLRRDGLIRKNRNETSICFIGHIYT